MLPVKDNILPKMNRLKRKNNKALEIWLKQHWGYWGAQQVISLTFVTFSIYADFFGERPNLVQLKSELSG